MSLKIYFSEESDSDLLSIWSYLAEKEGTDEADRILNLIEEGVYSLAISPERGHFPPELERVNEYNYKEIHFGPQLQVFRKSGSNNCNQECDK